MRRVLATVAVFSISISTGAMGQAVQRGADSVLTLNRTGHWAEAERLATTVLQENSPSQETVARCQLVASLAWALVRTKKPAEAAARLDLYERACKDEPSLTGFTAEVASMKKEIATATAPKRN